MPSWWEAHVTDIPYSGISIATLVLAIPAAPALNWLLDCKLARTLRIAIDKEAAIDKVIEGDADSFELLIRHSQNENAVMAITMKNDKVYIGWISQDFNPAFETKFVTLILLQSGYRDEGTKKLVRNIFYDEVLAKVTAEKQDEIRTEFRKKGLTDEEIVLSLADWEEAKQESLQFRITLPVSEVISANLFDIDLYERYFGLEQKLTPQPKSKPKKQV